MTSPETVPQDQEKRLKEKVDRTFFDTDFFLDSKIQFLLAEYGPAGPTYYLRIVLAILSEGGELSRKIATSFIKQLGKSEEEASDILNNLIEVGLLYDDGKFLRSSRADKEVGTLGDKREKWRIKQRLLRESKEKRERHPRESPECLGRHSVDSEEEEEEEEEHEDEKELENESGKGTGQTGLGIQTGSGSEPIPDRPSDEPGRTAPAVPPHDRSDPGKPDERKKLAKAPLEFPTDLESDPCRDALQEWLDHKKTRGESYKNNNSIQKLLNHWAKIGALRFCKAVDYSIRQNYSGLFEEQSRANQSGSGGFRRAPEVDPDTGYSMAFLENAKRIREMQAQEAREEALAHEAK